MIVIIDYKLSNLASITNALDNLRIPSKISSDFSVIKKAKALILPGVGAARQGMKNLKSKGLDKVIINEVKKGKPILGICLGMQLFLSFSEEGKVRCLNIIKGKVKKFRPKDGQPWADQDKLKVPQIGWNNVKIKDQREKSKDLHEFRTLSYLGSLCHPGRSRATDRILKGDSIAHFIRSRMTENCETRNLFKGIQNNSYFYFVNSYYCQPKDESIISATTNYGLNFCSVLIKNNLIGVQFHPEKSGQTGLKLLENFWRYYVN